MSEHARRLGAHYAPSDLVAAILAALRAAGKDPERLAPADLTPADQFHSRGREATLALAELAGLAPGLRVLDLGGGIGGPARTLAAERGCTVTVVDLTKEYCRAGAELTARTGLAGQVTFRHGDALALPDPDASFDVVWTQHSSMNIEDKERLYAEAHRVLRPGGRLAIHEIMAGPRQPIHFPVPWAREPSLSFLRAPDEIRALVARLGLAERAWREVTAATHAWFRERLAAMAAAGGPPPLGLHLLLGPDLGTMFRTLERNLAEERLAVVEAVWERPA